MVVVVVGWSEKPVLPLAIKWLLIVLLSRIEEFVWDIIEMQRVVFMVS